MLRALVPVEALAILTVALAPLPPAIPSGVPLLALASGSRWLRGRGWREVSTWRGAGAAGGALAGLVALGVAVPAYRLFSVTAVDWALLPATEDRVLALAVAMLGVAVNALALEMAMRGWLVERVLELSPGPTALPIAVAAACEALVMSGPAGERIGVALFGAGLGVLYVAAGRDVLASAAARATFAVGATLVQALGLVAGRGG